MVAVLLRAGTMYLKSMHHHDVHEVSIFPSIQYIVFTLIIIVIIIIIQHNFIKLQSAWVAQTRTLLCSLLLVQRGYFLTLLEAG